MKTRGLFITGTDTGIGKTWATVSLMRTLREAGLKIVGMKPVATGAVLSEGRWVNEDALALQEAASMPLPYEQVNPYVFEPPVSPHIAAEQAGQCIDLKRIAGICAELQEFADGVLVEGVGGWKAPLSRRETVADLAETLGLPVILVVGVRLGCLNHALLSHAAILASGVVFGGWVANHVVRDMPYAAENVRTLEAALGCAPLAELAYGEQPGQRSEDSPNPWKTDEILRLLAP